MSEPTNPTFQIPRDVIEPIIKAHVSTAIVQALGGHANIMSEAISAVLFTKVDSSGEADRYNSSYSKTRIDWLVLKVIKEAAEEVLKEAIVKHKEQLKKNMAAALSKKNSPLLKQLAEGLVGAISKEDTLKWRLNVSCEQGDR